MLIVPCDQRVTDFDLCTPVRANPRPRSTFSKSKARPSSMANSMNSVPMHLLRRGSRGSVACALGVRLRNWSSRNNSERRPSIAVDRAEPARI